MAALIALVLLGACGSGSGSSAPGGGPGAVVTPTPSSSPTPTPTPTPMPTPSPSPFGSLDSDRNFEAPAALLLYGRTDEGRVEFTGVSSGISNGYSYLAAPDAWRVRNLTGVTAFVEAHPSIDFQPSDIVSDQTNTRYVAYKRTIEGYDFTYKRLQWNANNDLLALNYSTIGYTLQGRSPPLSAYPTFTLFRQQQFSLGFDTPTAAALPSGDVRYRGVVLGGSTTFSPNPNTPVYEVTGTIDLTVNFATGTVSGSAVLAGKDDRTGAVVDLGTFPIAMIDGALAIVAPGGGPGGVVVYKAYGPAAEELGGVARVQFTPPGGRPTYIAVAFATKR